MLQLLDMMLDAIQRLLRDNSSRRGGFRSRWWVFHSSWCSLGGCDTLSLERGNRYGCWLVVHRLDVQLTCPSLVGLRVSALGWRGLRGLQFFDGQFFTWLWLARELWTLCLVLTIPVLRPIVARGVKHDLIFVLVVESGLGDVLIGIILCWSGCRLSNSSPTPTTVTMQGCRLSSRRILPPHWVPRWRMHGPIRACAHVHGDRGG